MKKVTLFIIIAFMATGAFAQAPQMMSYQTVIRDANGTLVQTAPVGIRISILEGNSPGTPVYVETQNTATNANGLASIAIGNGTVVSGTMAGINWGTGTYYIETKTDPTGGTNYTITGTAQLLSVPYALYAANSGGGGTANINGTANYVIKFTPNGTSGGNSLIYDNGASVLIGTTSPNYSNDVFEVQSGTGNAVSGFSSSSSYSGIYGFNSTTGTGITGYSTSGSGMIGYGSNSSYGAVQGINYNIYGTGVVGGGNDLGSAGAYVFTGGSGGAFTGSQYGALGYYSGANYPVAGGYFGNVPDETMYAYVAYFDGSTNYKILGTGTVSTIARGLNGDKITLHCPEAPEIYFEDYGEAKLTNGKAHINIDPLFAKNVIVNEKHPLRVYIQVEGECNGLYVMNKTSQSFDVAELHNGTSDISFQYHIVCNRADELSPDATRIISRNADLRFEKAPGPLKSTQSARAPKTTK